jgi:hypothetical protein
MELISVAENVGYALEENVYGAEESGLQKVTHTPKWRLRNCWTNHRTSEN